MLGSLLGSFGKRPFSHADKFKNLYFSNMGYSYYDRLHQNRPNHHISKQLKNFGQYQYFNLDEFVKVIVGKY